MDGMSWWFLAYLLWEGVAGGVSRGLTEGRTTTNYRAETELKLVILTLDGGGGGRVSPRGFTLSPFLARRLRKVRLARGRVATARRRRDEDRPAPRDACVPRSRRERATTRHRASIAHRARHTGIYVYMYMYGYIYIHVYLYIYIYIYIYMFGHYRGVFNKFESKVEYQIAFVQFIFKYIFKFTIS